MSWCCWVLTVWVLMAVGGAIFTGNAIYKMRGEENEKGVIKVLEGGSTQREK